MESTVLLLTGLVVYFVLIPALTFIHQERKHRLRWRRRWLVRRPWVGPGGPFRDEGTTQVQDYVVEVHGAPRVVKVVVVTSLVLGHMFIPALLAGLVCVRLGIVMLAGLILAARIYYNAYDLLRCDPAAAARARGLREFALILNTVVVVVAAMMMPFEPLRPLLALTAVYALISILHALGLGIAAAAIDAVHAGEAEGVHRPGAEERRLGLG